MNQLSEETANKLAKVINIGVNNNMPNRFSESMKTAANNIRLLAFIELQKELISYYKFDIKYPFNRLVYFIFNKYALKKIKQLNRDSKKLINYVT